MLSAEEAKEYLAMSDKDLACVANRYQHKPQITVIQGEEATRVDAPDWARGFLDAWSNPGSTNKFLKEKLGVILHAHGHRENRTDGECHVIYKLIEIPRDIKPIDSLDYQFELNNNYYRFECFVPVLRWGLQKIITKGG